MKERKQITIGLNRDRYHNLHRMKVALEENLGRRVDWGTYLMTLASPWSIDSIAAAIQYSERQKKESDLSVDYEAASQVTKQDIEEIVGEAADKIINELKKLLDSKTDEMVGKVDEETQPKVKDYYSRPLEA